MTFYRQLWVFFCVLTLGSTAHAEICTVDLEELTSDENIQYYLYFGQVGIRTDSSPAIALCLGRRRPGEAVSARLETELVAFADSASRGICSTTNYSLSNGEEGYNSFDAIVWQKDTIQLGIPENGIHCRDTYGLFEEEREDIVLQAASEANTVWVSDTIDDGEMSLIGTRASCSIPSGDYWTIYGKGSWWGGWGYFYSGEMYVCSGTYYGIDRICSYSRSTMESSGVI